MTTGVPYVVGVDPGARFVGLVLRSPRGTCDGAHILDRHRDLAGSDVLTWARFVAVTVDDWRQRHAARVACEMVTKPHPHGGKVDGRARVIDPGPIIETAHVVGALALAFHDLLAVAPAGNGTHVDAAYPPELAKGTRGLGGPTKHARAAWDVAGSGAWAARITLRGAPR